MDVRFLILSLILPLITWAFSNMRLVGKRPKPPLSILVRECRREKIPLFDEHLSSLQSFHNITFTEWSFLGDIRFENNEKDWDLFYSEMRTRGFEVNEFNAYDPANVNTGSTNSNFTLSEVLWIRSDIELPLNIFRRNIALRANRVLHPARNAQIFSTLINTMIGEGMWEKAMDVVGYVGLVPTKYVCKNSGGDFEINIDTIANYVCRKMLELDLDRMAWIRQGRLDEEPSTPRSRGESVQEWLYTQVHRSDLGFRVCDMIMAVSRLGLRSALASCSGDEQPLSTINVVLRCNELFANAGIPLGPEFAARLKR